VSGKLDEIPNDYSWIFAGGEPPNTFLKKIGIGFRMCDLISEGSNEAKRAVLARKELVGWGTS
jgi:hypothetical protein